MDALCDLRDARDERDDALRVARDAVHALQGSVSLWPRDYPAWFVYALLGDAAWGAGSPPPEIAEDGPYAPVRALVALVEGEG